MYEKSIQEKADIICCGICIEYPKNSESITYP